MLPFNNLQHTHEGERLDFGDGHSVSTSYAVLRPPDQEMINETVESKSEPLVHTTPSEDNNTVDLTTVEGEDEDQDIITNSQEDTQEINSNAPHTNSRRNKIATRDIETFQSRLGNVPVKDLLLGV